MHIWKHEAIRSFMMAESWKSALKTHTHKTAKSTSKKKIDKVFLVKEQINLVKMLLEGGVGEQF